MKRLLMILLVLILMMSSALADGETTLLSYAIELGRELDVLAEDEDRSRIFTNDPEVLAMVRSYGAGDHDEPYEVRAVVLDEMTSMLSAEMAELPEAGKRQVQNALPGMVRQSYMNAFGVKAIVANAILNTNVHFASVDAEGQGLWILLYEDAAPVAVSWYAENGAVYMEASFLPGDASDFETRAVAAARPELDAYAHTLAAELQELARNKQYLMMLGLPEEVMGRLLDYPTEENAAPRLVLCTLTEDAQSANACLTQQIAYLGDAALAAAASMHGSVLFANEDAAGTGLYLFLYEDGVPIIVTWKGENGAYHLSAAFQPGENPYACRSVGDANAWAASIGLNVRFQLPGAMLLP